MHDMGETFDMMQVMNLDAAKFTHLPHIIAGKVNEHIMFGQFLRIVCQILFQRIMYWEGLVRLRTR